MATPKLALIPTGYKAGKVYSVLPESGVGDFDFTRASEATRINSAGLLESVATGVPRLEYPLIDGVVNGCPSLLLENQATNLITYPISFGNPYWIKSGATIEGDASTAGSELITNGDFAGGSTGWNFGSNVSIGSGAMTFDRNGGTSLYAENTLLSTANANSMYLVEFDIISNTSDSNIMRVGGVGSADITSTVHSVDISSGKGKVFIIANGSLRYKQGLNFADATSGVLVIDNVSVKEVQGYSSPSVDFPTSAFKLVEDTSTGQHEMRGDNNSVSTTEPYSYSFYAKYGGRRYIGIKALNAESTYCYFDILNKLVVSSGAYTCSIDELTNGWMRINVVIPNTLSAASVSVRYYLSDDGLTISYTGDGTSGVYLFMAQAEQGSYATSPTLTSLTAEGTTTTRVAEVCNGAGDASTFNDSEGVLMVEISALADDGSAGLISLSDGTTSNRITIELDGNIVKGRLTPSVGILNASTNITISTKIVLKYKENDFALWVNGFEAAVSNSGNTFSNGTLTELAFDRGDGAEDFYGKTKQIQYFQTVLTDAELETLTSWTSFTAMANAQNYSII